MTEDTQTEQPKKTVITVPDGGIEFRGEDGELLAALTPLKGGGAALTLCNPAGAAVRMKADEHGVDVSMNGPNGERGVEIAAVNGHGMFTLWGQAGLAASICTDKESGGGNVIVHSAEGYPQIALLSHEYGGSLLALTNQQEAAVSLGALADGGGGLQVRDENGVQVFAAPLWKFTDKATQSE